jgi:hypothetical protein
MRDILGLDSTTIPNTEADKYIDWAQEVLRKLLEVDVVGEELALDETNNYLYVEHPWIADTNWDGIVDKNDVKVWGWTDQDDESTKTALTVSTVYEGTGQIVLESGQNPSDYDKITVDYSYFTCQPNWALISLATAQMAAWLWVQKELLLVPSTWVVGPVRISHGYPWKHLWESLQLTLNQIRTYGISGKHPEIKDFKRTPLSEEA